MISSLPTRFTFSFSQDVPFDSPDACYLTFETLDEGSCVLVGRFLCLQCNNQTSALCGGWEVSETFIECFGSVSVSKFFVSVLRFFGGSIPERSIRRCAFLSGDGSRPARVVFSGSKTVQ